MKQQFAERLAQLRIQNNLSQKELAYEVKVTPSSLSNYENGIYLPPLEKACSLAAALHTSLDYLTGLSDRTLSPALLSRKISEKYTFYHAVRFFAALEDKELGDLVTYAQFLKYKHKRRQYSEPSQSYMVAEANLSSPEN